MSDFLPVDLVINILTRLPIKTLAQCACVCKSWYSLISNPNFITAHLNRSYTIHNHNNNVNNLLLLRSPTGNDGSEVGFSLLRWEEDGMFHEYSEVELPLKTCRNSCLRVVGSCNGLLCLSDDLAGYIGEIHLWNPSIHKTMSLPPVRVNFSSYGPFSETIGFGFDSRTDDYKVVRIVFSECEYNYEAPPEIDIFTVSSGKWRNISHLGLPYMIRERMTPAFLEGAAHWPAWDRRNWSDLIVSFHMGEEKFGVIMPPCGLVATDWAMRGGRIARVQESLAVIEIKSNATYSIWVMEEYGLSESWTKLLTIDLSGDLLSGVVVGFTRRCKLLFGTKQYLLDYDPEATPALRLRSRCAWPKFWDIRGDANFYAGEYIESLVLLGAKEPVLNGKVRREMEQGSDPVDTRIEEPKECGELLKG